jgi:hypothetical protein
VQHIDVRNGLAEKTPCLNKLRVSESVCHRGGGLSWPGLPPQYIPLLAPRRSISGNRASVLATPVVSSLPYGQTGVVRLRHCFAWHLDRYWMADTTAASD